MDIILETNLSGIKTVVFHNMITGKDKTIEVPNFNKEVINRIRCEHLYDLIIEYLNIVNKNAKALYVLGYIYDSKQIERAVYEAKGKADKLHECTTTHNPQDFAKLIHDSLLMQLEELRHIRKIKQFNESNKKYTLYTEIEKQIFKYYEQHILEECGTL